MARFIVSTHLLMSLLMSLSHILQSSYYYRIGCRWRKRRVLRIVDMSGKKRDVKITHKIMSAIPSKDTKPEIALRKALWHEKLRYRVNYKKLPGKPDIVFTKYRIAVFCVRNAVSHFKTVPLLKT